MHYCIIFLSALQSRIIKKEKGTYIMRNKTLGQSIYPIKNGKYGISFYYYDINGRKQRKAFTDKDKDALLQKKEQFLSSLEKQKAAHPSVIYEEGNTLVYGVDAYNLQSIPSCFSIPVPQMVRKNVSTKTISEIIKEYMEDYIRAVTYSTYKQTLYFSRLVDERIGSMKINNFSHKEFQALMNDLAYMDNQMPRAEKSLKGIKTFVITLLKFAKRQHLISAEDFDNATENIRIPKCAAIYDKNSRFMDYDSLGFMLNTLKDNPRYYLMVRILALTGMRGQELLALEKKDLVRSKNYIYVHQALVEQDAKASGGRNFILGKTKTTSSVRKVPAIDEVFTYFDQLEQLMKESGARKKSIAAGNQNFVIVDKNGNIVDKRALIRNLGNYSKRHNGKGLGLHTLRHCYMSYLEQLGVDTRYIELSVGHVQQGVAAKYYFADSDTYIKMLLPEIKKIEENINQALEKYNK